MAASTASLSDIKIESISVSIDGSDSNYTVVDSRYDETGTAAVLFGIAGAAINSAANASEDEKKADRFRAAAEAIDLNLLIEESLVSTLEKRGDPPLGAEGEASHELVVEIRNWGLIRVGKDDQRLRAFLNLTLKLLNNKGDVVWEKKRENSIGQNPVLLDEFTDEKFTSDMEAVARKAGQYIGNQIIYR